MPDPSATTVGHLLQRMAAGDKSAFNQLLPLVYDELHRIAQRHRRKWQGQDTLVTTAIIHEAYLKLADRTAPEWQNRTHFLAVASTAMRQVLVDHARRRAAGKRGSGIPHIPLHEMELALGQSEDPSAAADELLIALEESLGRLEQHNRRHLRIVECRFFGGMSIEETAVALGTSPATVKRGWRMAQAWLHRDLHQAVEESA